jgi:hypothetical protein
MRARSGKVADYCSHAVASVDRAMPVGMITDRDIAIEVVAFGMDASALTAGDIMSTASGY